MRLAWGCAYRVRVRVLGHAVLHVEQQVEPAVQSEERAPEPRLEVQRREVLALRVPGPQLDKDPNARDARPEELRRAEMSVGTAVRRLLGEQAGQGRTR